MPSHLSDARERVIQQLSAHFAADHVTVDALEDRLERVYKATSEGELMALVSDLPALHQDYLPATRQGYELARADETPNQKVVFAMMGGVERRGVWAAARQMLTLAFMGGVEVDLREARFPPDGIVIDAYTMWGGIEIVVPPGVRVECDGFAIMGGFGQTNLSREVAPSPSPDAPRVRIRGLAVWGYVEVQVAGPGELPAEIKKRRKKKALQPP
ncbi:MAG: DUF1707 domain-containing protein [Gemmatimonadaceae bacterium]